MPNSNLSSRPKAHFPLLGEGAMIRTVPVHCVYWRTICKRASGIFAKCSFFRWKDRFILKNPPPKGWFFSVANPVYFDTRNDCTRYSSANAVWIRKMQPSVYLNGEYLDDKRKHNQFVIMSIPLWSVAASIAPTACAITCPSALMKKEVGSE